MKIDYYNYCRLDRLPEIIPRVELDSWFVLRNIDHFRDDIENLDGADADMTCFLWSMTQFRRYDVGSAVANDL